MLLLLAAYVAGGLTILSPCILPVLPFVFAKSDQPFWRSGFPILLGMAATFTVFSAFAVIGGAFVVEVSRAGRVLALAGLFVVGISLLLPAASERVFEPLQRLGNRISAGADRAKFGGAFLIGMGTGLLWAPCAGPILGLILSGAASQDSLTESIALLAAYSLGAMTSLALALAVGGRALTGMKKYWGADRPVRTLLGVAVLLGVLAIGLGWDRTVLTKLSKVSTEKIETKILELTQPESASEAVMGMQSANAPAAGAPVFRLTGATGWLNSKELSFEALLGRVVLIDFWTYSCINCLRTLPHVKSWAQKYQEAGLVVVGVHTPEFAFERDLSNVTAAVRELGVSYPVAMDSNYVIWNAFKNRYWPAHYVFDRAGKLRHTQFGEGGYEKTETVLRGLLNENRSTEISAPVGANTAEIGAVGRAAPPSSQIVSPETYLGYRRAKSGMSQPSCVPDQRTRYGSVASLSLNQWAVEGDWTCTIESLRLEKTPGKLSFRFRARDLNLVLGSDEGQPIRFRVKIDGRSPARDHGVDTEANGEGTVRGYRLYQLIRRQNSQDGESHLFEIEFLDAGVEAFAFTFG